MAVALKNARLLFNLLTVGCSLAVILEPCGKDGVVELPINSSTFFEFGCRVASGSDSVLNLAFYDKDAKRHDVGWCSGVYSQLYSCKMNSYTSCNNMFNCGCLSNCVKSTPAIHGLYFSRITRPNAQCTYAMEPAPNSMTPDVRSQVIGSTLLCRHGSTEVNCTIDIVHPTEGVKCNLTLVTESDPWQMVSHCQAEKTYSGLGRYSCHLLALHENAANSAVVTMHATPPTSPDVQVPVSGSCEMRAALPPGDGLFNYAVLVQPGNVTVAFDNPIQIQRPSASDLDHNCSAPVREGQDVNCACTLRVASLPPAAITWFSKLSSAISPKLPRPSSQLSLVNVTRWQHGQEHVCRLAWGGQEWNVTYVLNVTCPRPDLSHWDGETVWAQCPDEIPGTDEARRSLLMMQVGLGTGLPAAVIIIAVVIIVVVVVLKRKRKGSSLKDEPPRRSIRHISSPTPPSDVSRVTEATGENYEIPEILRDRQTQQGQLYSSLQSNERQKADGKESDVDKEVSRDSDIYQNVSPPPVAHLLQGQIQEENQYGNI